MQSKPLKVMLKTRAGKQAAGDLTLKTFTAEETKKRAIKIAGVAGGITFAAIFLPIAHFFLVPAGLVITPVLFRQTLKQNEQLDRGDELNCPNCSKALSFQARWKWAWPLEDFCSHCRNVISIDPHSVHQVDASLGSDGPK